jgi:hypothetical protein
VASAALDTRSNAVRGSYYARTRGLRDNLSIPNGEQRPKIAPLRRLYCGSYLDGLRIYMRPANRYDEVSRKPCCWDERVPITVTLDTKKERAAIPFPDALAFCEEPLGS